MPGSILPFLADMMPDTMTAQYGTLDEYGRFISSGEALSIPCYIEGGQKKITDRAGKEIVSNIQVFTGEENSLNVQNYRFTLPSRYDPYQNLLAVFIDKASDENGANYEVVMFQ